VNPIVEGIADGLAENGYAVSDQFLSQVEVDRILRLKEFNTDLEHFRKAGIGKNEVFILTNRFGEIIFIGLIKILLQVL